MNTVLRHLQGANVLNDIKSLAMAALAAPKQFLNATIQLLLATEEEI